MLRANAHAKDRIEHARAIVSLLASTLGHQEPVALEGPACFGLYTLLVEIEEQLGLALVDLENVNIPLEAIHE